MADRSNGNLRRGNIDPNTGLIPQPHGGAIRKGGHNDGRPDNFEVARRREREIRERITSEPDDALEVVNKELAVWASKIARRGARNGSLPDSSTMSIMKEFRQTLEAVNEARRNKGAISEARDFFQTIEERVQDCIDRIGEPQPAFEP